MATIRNPHCGLVSPFPAACVAGALSLFLGAALSDAAYGSSHEIQWSNFAAWLLAGGLIFAAVALVCALRDVLSARRRTRGAVIYAIVLGLAWIVGVLDSLVHARDAWATMPTGLVHSWIAFALTAVATWLAFRRPATGEGA
jgi:uncharacterized membrane protein